MVAAIYPPRIGGPATQCAHLCRALVARGHQVSVATFADRRSDEVEPSGVRVARLPWRYGLGPLDKLARWVAFPFQFAAQLRSEKPQVVVCHSVSVPLMVAGWMCRRRKVPCVVKFAGDWVFETLNTYSLKTTAEFRDTYRTSFLAKIMTVVERWGLRQFDVAWATSEFRRQNLALLLPASKRVWLQNNCLLLPIFPDVPRGELVTLLSANRFVPHKRLEMLLQAYAAIDPAIRGRSRLVLVGGGAPDYEAQIKALAQQLALGDSVSFPGVLPDDQLYAAMAGADVYVSTSREESFPNVMIEAMAAGLPVVASRVGGIPELVREGVEGYLPDVDDTAGMTARMAQLIGDADERGRLSAAARARAAEFDLSRHVQRFEDLYNSLANPTVTV